MRGRDQQKRRTLALASALMLGVAGLLALDNAGATPAAAAPQGFLYRVTPPAGREGHALYLYGTLHVGRTSSLGLDEATTALIAQCQHMALELDPHDSEGIRRALQAYAVYPPGDQLSAHVPQALDQQAMAVAAQVHFPAKSAEQLHPWMLANILSQLSLLKSGFDPRHGSEILLADAALKNHIDVSEVEGPEVQYKILGGAPEDVQIDALKRTLEQIDNGHIADQAGELLSAWEKSDVAAIDALLATLRDEPGLYPHFMTSELLEARNVVMADVAIRDMNQPGMTFFAVGALHLFGPKGLIEELKRRGYTVTPLSRPAS
jgi:uncharacterized protein YbaP (TraB family)